MKYACSSLFISAFRACEGGQGEREGKVMALGEAPFSLTRTAFAGVLRPGDSPYFRGAASIRETGEAVNVKFAFDLALSHFCFRSILLPSLNINDFAFDAIFAAINPVVRAIICQPHPVFLER